MLNRVIKFRRRALTWFIFLLIVPTRNRVMSCVRRSLIRGGLNQTFQRNQRVIGELQSVIPLMRRKFAVQRVPRLKNRLLLLVRTRLPVRPVRSVIMMKVSMMRRLLIWFLLELFRVRRVRWRRSVGTRENRTSFPRWPSKRHGFQRNCHPVWQLALCRLFVRRRTFFMSLTSSRRSRKKLLLT